MLKLMFSVLSYNERRYLEQKGYFTYSLRNWDEGDGCSLEKNVMINNVGEVVTDKEITYSDEQDRLIIYDFDDYVEKNKIDYNNKEFNNTIMSLLNERKEKNESF